MTAPAAQPDIAPTPARAPASLWVTLTITFLGSLGTGAATNGVYFIAEQMHAFSRPLNLSLAVFFGLLFVPCAFLSGHMTRWLERRLGLSERGVLIAVLWGTGLVCLLTGAVDAPWGVWAFVACFAPLTGMLWPLVEGFVSGGRRGAALRTATGRFNLAWAGATFAAFWLMRPLLARDPALVFVGLGAVHVAAALLALRLPPFPARHGSAAHDHDPEEAARYRRLLHCFRLLLMGSYILLSALNPLLPARFSDLGVREEADRVLYASAWLGSRLLAFALLERWHAWQGSRALLAWSGGLMLVGVAGALTAPGVWTAVAALTVMGFGIGTAYAGALYYAMEVGDARVDAGGFHEAMIGVGYTLGPLSALIAVGGTNAVSIDSEHADRWVLLPVGLLAAVIAGLLIRRATRPLHPRERV